MTRVTGLDGPGVEFDGWFLVWVWNNVFGEQETALRSVHRKISEQLDLWYDGAAAWTQWSEARGNRSEVRANRLGDRRLGPRPSEEWTTCRSVHDWVNVTASRVTQLARDNVIDGYKTSRGWIVNTESVARYYGLSDHPEGTANTVSNLKQTVSEALTSALTAAGTTLPTEVVDRVTTTVSEALEPRVRGGEAGAREAARRFPKTAN